MFPEGLRAPETWEEAYAYADACEAGDSTWRKGRIADAWMRHMGHASTHAYQEARKHHHAFFEAMVNHLVQGGSEAVDPLRRAGAAAVEDA